jgi:hypothetical protein
LRAVHVSVGKNPVERLAYLYEDGSIGLDRQEFRREQYMAFVKRIFSLRFTVGVILAVLTGGLIEFAYQRIEDAHNASKAEAEPPVPPEKEKSGLLEIKKPLQSRQEEMGRQWVENGDKAAADGLTDLALIAYKTGLAYLEDSGGCQSAMAKAVRAKISNLQKKPYDFPCGQTSDNVGTKGK